MPAAGPLVTAATMSWAATPAAPVPGETERRSFSALRGAEMSAAQGLLASWAMVRLASVVGAQWIAIPFFGGLKTRKGRKT